MAEFILDTSKEHFAVWLQAYINPADGVGMRETVTGWAIIQAIPAPQMSPELTAALLKIFDQEPTPATASTTAGHQEAITIDLQALAPARVLVATSCTAPEFETYYADLLAEVGRLWPESGLVRKTDRPGGRPRDARYDKAAAMLDAGKSVSAAMTAIGLDPDSKNDRDTFRVAMNRRRSERNE